MAIRQLLNLARRSRKGTPSRSGNHFSTSSVAVAATGTEALSPSAPPPTAMIYDRLAESVKNKLHRLENPDSRFLQYNSPHPVLMDHTPILAAPVTRVTTLPNGLRVATESNLAARTASVGVFIDSGSRFETEETNGTAHFLEHMIFKGTERRTARELEEEIENMGGHLNAYTSREQTTFYAKVLDRDIHRALDILADIIQNSKFDENRIDRERDVILREMEEVIVASGPVKHEDFVGEVQKLFTNLSTNPTTASDLIAKGPSVFTGSEVRMIDDDIPLAQFAVAFEGASWTDPDSIALMVMQTMLGSWNKNAGGGKHMGSELAQRISINEIAENMMAFNTNYKDTGLFGVYASAKPDCLDDLAYSIMYELSKLCYRVSEADVTRARNQLKSSLMLHIDGTSPVAEDIGRQLLTYGRRIPFSELFARIDAVDSSTVKRVANRFIFDRDVAISAVGPIQNLPDYNWFRRRTYWLRY
ncbi:unnamed protein product [Cuscuta campestris]|uniref:Peptidase M16 N-terminal domain-containing protein n=1 Tax=Cuscuta campestris TaxID=132261 RepID=A0A484K475_9ASTE|nr:unnamed protein product [Cuscuta campestris]